MFILATLLALLSQSNGAIVNDAPNKIERHLAPDNGIIECRLWDNCMMLEGGVSTHEWECSIEGFLNEKILVGTHGENIPEYMKLNAVNSGEKILVLKDTVAISDTHIIVDFEEDIIGFQDFVDENRRRRRGLVDGIGLMNTLVVRVNGADNDAPPASDLSDDIFGDEWCLKSQSNKCSYGKMNVQEYVPGNGISDVQTVATGVVEIDLSINANGNHYSTFQSQANAALRTMFGVTNVGSLFDLVLFCMPPGMGSWLAYAYIGRWDSYYNNDWCQSMSAQMHEVGHNLGLHHSGEGSSYNPSVTETEYGDQSGFMGYSYRSDDGPQQCYNAPKNYQLGWYPEYTIDIEESELCTGPTEYILNGLVDYQDMSENANIILRVGEHYYISYNRRASFNSGTQEGGNQVMVHQMLGDPSTDTISLAREHLSAGGTYSFSNDDSSLTVEVKVTQAGAKDAIVELSVSGTGANACSNPTQSPTTRPTSVPTSMPTNPPTAGPTNLPTNTPTNSPTAGPTNAPTSIPTNLPTTIPTSAPVEPTNPPVAPTNNPTTIPTSAPVEPTNPTVAPTNNPTSAPVEPTNPTVAPTNNPTTIPTDTPVAPTSAPVVPTIAPTTTAPVATNPPVEPKPTEPPATNDPGVTESPTYEPSSTDCSDDPDWRYRGKNLKKCKWLAKKEGKWDESKIKKFCNKRANKDKKDKTRVYEYCKETCHFLGGINLCPWL